MWSNHDLLMANVINGVLFKDNLCAFEPFIENIGKRFIRALDVQNRPNANPVNQLAIIIKRRNERVAKPFDF